MNRLLPPVGSTASRDLDARRGPISTAKPPDRLDVPAGAPRYVLVSGNYQAGISVVDFSDPANATEIAYADPPPLVNPQNPAGIELGGDWSTYWYNGRIYESDITRGLIIWRFDDPRVATYLKTPYLNPQTTEFSIRR